MGSPKLENNPFFNTGGRVEVTLTKGFWLGKYEVTQSEWQRVMQTNPWKGRGGAKDGGDYAASYLSWEDVMKFCERLTDDERRAGRLPIGWKYTLPTEAQWEYACRAGTTTQYSFGDDESKLGDYAWFKANAGDVGESYAHPGGRKTANAWGLHDMHGNVWEWCRDVRVANLPGGTDPEVLTGATERVYRSGAWDDRAGNCTTARRDSMLPDERWGQMGFRVACVQ
jgi:formylglycine-generating enzyme required for sulfatase activity